MAYRIKEVAGGEQLVYEWTTQRGRHASMPIARCWQSRERPYRLVFYTGNPLWDTVKHEMHRAIGATSFHDLQAVAADFDGQPYVAAQMYLHALHARLLEQEARHE